MFHLLDTTTREELMQLIDRHRAWLVEDAYAVCVVSADIGVMLVATHALLGLGPVDRFEQIKYAVFQRVKSLFRFIFGKVLYVNIENQVVVRLFCEVLREQVEVQILGQLSLELRPLNLAFFDELGQLLRRQLE